MRTCGAMMRTYVQLYCSGIHSTYYCSAACQKKDWKKRKLTCCLPKAADGHCEYCKKVEGTDDIKLTRCNNCKRACYCSRACQKQD